MSRKKADSADGRVHFSHSEIAESAFPFIARRRSAAKS
jgi:hypothetical protein